MMKLSHAADLIDVISILGDKSIEFARVMIDSRKICHGDLFIALRGERFDAHDFLERSAKNGAVAAIVDLHSINRSNLKKIHQKTSLSLLQTKDTRLALRQLAAGWRSNFNLPIIAITGSNGKTTVKEMIAAIFNKAVGSSLFLATPENLNNDIGVSMTLLQLNALKKLAVVEIGVNRLNETSVLMKMCWPTVVLINNAQREHQQFMINTQKVASEHATAFSYLPSNGLAVFPAFDRFSEMWHRAAGTHKTLTFALEDECSTFNMNSRCKVDVLGRIESRENLQIIYDGGKFITKLRVLGRHNMHNALAAATCAIGVGIKTTAIRDGLSTFQPIKGRLQTLVARCRKLEGAIVINDSYNANPESVKAAIDVLCKFTRPRLLILGDMAEIGKKSQIFHYEVGTYARMRGIDGLFTLGSQALASWKAFSKDTIANGGHFISHEALFHAVVKKYESNVTILVKGSRCMKMELLVHAFTLCEDIVQVK